MQEPPKKYSLSISRAASTLEISLCISNWYSAPGTPTYSTLARVQPCEFEIKFPKKTKVHGHVRLWGGELQEYLTHGNDSNRSENFRGEKEEETKRRAGKAKIARCKWKAAYRTKYIQNLSGARRYAISFVKPDFFLPMCTAQHLLCMKVTSLVMQHTHNCKVWVFFMFRFLCYHFNTLKYPGKNMKKSSCLSRNTDCVYRALCFDPKKLYLFLNIWLMTFHLVCL